MKITCTCGCAREYPESKIHDMGVKKKLSKLCIAKLRAMPRTIRSGPQRELPKMVRTMIGGGR